MLNFFYKLDRFLNSDLSNAFMNNKNMPQLFLTFFVIGSLFYMTIPLIQVEKDVLSISLASASLSNSKDIVTEGNSTFLNSTEDASLGGDGGDTQQNVATITVIPNPNSNTAKSGLSGLNDTISPSKTNKTDQTPMTGAAVSAGDAKNQQSIGSSVNNSSTSPEMQRGEYLVDNNGIHYYNIDNCSMVKGSSGIGNLSECEDAEREIQEELTG
jgi:hypothetical protein